MHRSLFALVLVVLLLFSAWAIGAVPIEQDSFCEDGDCSEYTHVVVRLAKRDDARAALIAEQSDMRVVGQPFLNSNYFFQHLDHILTSIRQKREAVERLKYSADVKWVKVRRPKRRGKLNYLRSEQNAADARETDGRADMPIWNDPLFPDQWYLNKGAVGNYDMNVREAWQLGYSGRGVVVSIVDDGVQRDHPDLQANYDPLASTDINDNDDDPTPQNNYSNRQGTMSASIVAASAGNKHCGVGVAYNAKIGGIRMLDGEVNDSMEGKALSFRQDHIDIYLMSWGPSDDGSTFDGPGPLARQAFFEGVTEGRDGKGNIFVWASGVGGENRDSCSADGYTTSIYTLSISSATFDNRRPPYLEECPSTIATTYSSAGQSDTATGLVAADVPSGCRKQTAYGGTGGSAAIAAGILALALEANLDLTWRDVQHLVLRTANPTPLLNNSVSNKFGYGLMDGVELVKLAKKWQKVPEQHMCTYEYKLPEPNPRPLTGQFRRNFTLSVGDCKKGTPVMYLEHVQVNATVRFGKRGDLRLTLFSPRGTSSELLPPRPKDFNTNGFHTWPFMTLQMWSENPRGDWTLMVESVSVNPDLHGTFHGWKLLLFGTETPAQSYDAVQEPSYETV